MDNLDVAEETFLEKNHTVIMGTLIFTLSFTGIVANIIVLSIVARKPKLKTSINIYLASIAVLDILSCFMDMMLEPIDRLTGGFVVKVSSCHMLKFFQMFIEIFASSSIAMAFPLFSYRSSLSTRQCWKFITVTAIIATVIAVCFGYDAVKLDVPGYGYICSRNWNKGDFAAFMKHFYSFIFLVLPLLATIISVILRRAKKKEYFNRSQDERMMLILVIVYLACWTPMFIVRILLVYSIMYSGYLIVVLATTAFIISMLPAVGKIFIYMNMDQRFKAEVKELFYYLLKIPQPNNFLLQVDEDY